jgi:sialic acid synthase SpsE
LGIGVAIASVTYGATVVEKHFTLDRNEGGVDAAFSLEPWEMKLLKVETMRAKEAFGKITYSGTSSEQKSKQFRQSIYPKNHIKKGELFSKENLKICRPGFSLSPSTYDEIIGKLARRDIVPGERLTPNDF